MTQMTEEHFELIDRNKDINMQRNKIKYLEDRIATLEKSISALNHAVGELMKEYMERGIND